MARTPEYLVLKLSGKVNAKKNLTNMIFRLMFCEIDINYAKSYGFVQYLLLTQFYC